MAVTFGSDWAQEVADVSTLPEYQNAVISIIDPTTTTQTGNPIDGYEFTKGTVKWTGQARISSNRSSVGAGGTTSTNPTNIKAMRVQIPYDKDFQNVERGWQVRIVDGGRNSRIENNLFIIESDVNSSQVAALTFECTVDVESNPNWS